MMHVAPRDLVLLLGITLIWGINVIVSKIGVSQIPPIFFTFLRFALVAVLLCRFLKIHRGQMGALCVAAILSGALHFAFSFAGLHLAENVSSVAIAGQLGIPFTTLLSVALLGEVVRWRRWLGICCAFSGVLVMSLDPQIMTRWESLALVCASAFVGSLGVIAIKKLYGFHPLELQAWLAVASLPVLLLASFLFEQPQNFDLLQLPLSVWGALAFTAVFSSIIAHSGYFYLIQKYPITSVAPLTTLSPVFTVIFSVLLLGEQLTAKILLGGALTLCGVFVITWREQRIVDTST